MFPYREAIIGINHNKKPIRRKGTNPDHNMYDLGSDGEVGDVDRVILPHDQNTSRVANGVGLD